MPRFTSVHERWGGRRPKKAREALARISEELGANAKGDAFVRDPANPKRWIRISAQNILRHVMDSPERWALVPLVGPCITEAASVRPAGVRKGDLRRLYAAHLRSTRRGVDPRDHYFLTYVGEDPAGRRYLATWIDVQDPADWEGRVEGAGAIEWRAPNPLSVGAAHEPSSHGNATPGTPTHGRRPRGVSRSSRTRTLSPNSTTGRRGPEASWADSLVVLGAAVLLGMLSQHAGREAA